MFISSERSKQMTYQITRTKNGRTVTLKNAINLKPHTFETREDAEHFANSCFQTERSDWKNQGRRLATFRVIEA
jgi:hypothetical protein